MKICWITSFPPRQSGVAVYSSSILEELGRICQVDIIPWNYDSWLGKIISPLKNMLKLRKALVEYDIVHVQYILGEYMFFFLPMLWLITAGKKARIVMTLHEDYKNLRISWLVIWFHNLFYNCSDLLMVHTNEHKKTLSKRLQKKTIVITFGTRPQYKKSPVAKKNTVLMHGFINQWKGHDLAIRAIALVKQKIPNIKLIIAGKPYDKKFTQYIERLIAELGLQKNVNLDKDFLPRKEFTRLIEESDICVLPYRRITMSGVLSDVVGFSKPAVLSDLAVFREYTKNLALYAPVDDYRVLAEKITILLTDRKIREKMRKDFMHLAKEYSWKRVAETTYTEYTRLFPAKVS